jgi:hypothetical protein
MTVPLGVLQAETIAFQPLLYDSIWSNDCFEFCTCVVFFMDVLVVPWRRCA